MARTKPFKNLFLTRFYLFISGFVNLGTNQNENPIDHFDMEDPNTWCGQLEEKFTN
jgi:hypothetical protein